MDIVCPECKTEYEFDERHVTASGVSVQCTSCGFTFKVRRREVVEVDTGEAASVRSGRSEQPPWVIRSSAGESLRFHELATLQQWIIDRRVSRADEISRTGETWKPLGTIPELASFFQAAQAQAARERGTGPNELNRTEDDEPLTLGGMDDVPTDEPAFARDSSDFVPVARRAAWERSPMRVSTSGPYPPVDDELPRRSGGKFLGLALLSLLLVALGGLFVFKPHLPGDFFRGLFTSEAPSDAAYSRARELFLRDDRVHLDAADRELGQVAKQGALVRAARAEVYTVWAQHLRDEAELLTRRAASFEAAAKEAAEQLREVLSARARTRGRRTRQQANSGADQQPSPELLRRRAEMFRAAALEVQSQAQQIGNEATAKIHIAAAQLDAARGKRSERAEVSRAFADLHRLQKKPDVLELLGQVRRTKPDDAEAHYVEGLFRAGRGDLTHGIAALRTSVAEMQAQYKQLLLRAATAQGLIHLRQSQHEEARKQLDAVLEANPEHNWAKLALEQLALEQQGDEALERLAREIVANGPPATKAVVDAGFDAKATRPEVGIGSQDGHKVPAPQSRQRQPSASAPRRQARDEDKAESRRKLGYDQLIRAGNRAIEHGHTMRALDYFERALDLRSAGLEALTGIGYAQLDLQRFTSAMKKFREAVALSPAYGEATIGLAETFLAMGNKAQALDHYRAYLKAHPGGPKAALARRNARDLERALEATRPEPETAAESPTAAVPVTKEAAVPATKDDDAPGAEEQGASDPSADEDPPAGPDEEQAPADIAPAGAASSPTQR